MSVKHVLWSFHCDSNNVIDWARDTSHWEIMHDADRKGGRAQNLRIQIYEFLIFYLTFFFETAGYWIRRRESRG